MGHYQLNPHDIHYYDFAYEPKGPFRMAAQNIGDAPAKTFAELLSGPMVDIYVGEDRRHWRLHQNLLYHHSPYFETQLDRGSSPKKGIAEGGKLELLEEDPGAFELLVKWLYQGKIDDVSEMPAEKKWDYADSCQKLYTLCNRIELPQLKNFAIDQFRKGCNEAGLVPGPEEMKPIYDKTPPESPFRKLVSRIAARQIMDPDSERDASTYRDCFEGHADFAVDVINAIRTGAGGKLFDDPTEGDACEFHEHENGQTCDDKPRKVVNFANGTKEPHTPDVKAPEENEAKSPKPPDAKPAYDNGAKIPKPPDMSTPGRIDAVRTKSPEARTAQENGAKKPKTQDEMGATKEPKIPEVKTPDQKSIKKPKAPDKTSGSKEPKNPDANTPNQNSAKVPKTQDKMSGANGVLKA